MEGVAIHWFSILMEVHPNLTWGLFKSELLERFSGLEIQNPYEELAALHQRGTVQEYVEEFEYLTSLVPRQPEQQYVGYFLNGLKEEIRCWVRIHNPETRLQAMRLARNVELAMKKSTGPYFRLSGQRGDINYPQKQDQRAGSSSIGGSTAETANQPVVGAGECDTYQHKSGRREEKKGLCFRCGMPYSPLHKCADPKLRVVVLGEDEEMNAEGEMMMAGEVGPEMDEGQEEGEYQVLEYLGVTELFQTQVQSAEELTSMKVEGRVEGIPVLI
ncbi:Retrotransposon gag domain [Sesbania bispinosa]|nr:Retrotransposon gag domain [Sesbania bispinosa]